MGSGEFDDEEFFRAISKTGARVLIIGRRALILLGAPVMTAHYDVWVHIDDIEKLNTAFDALAHAPSRTPDEARKTGRYVIENGERIDVIVARSASTPAGVALAFEAAWTRRQPVSISGEVTVFLPSIEDLITTKRWGSRPKDLVDIQFLETLRRRAP